MASSTPPSAAAQLTCKASAVGPELSSHTSKVLSPTMGTTKGTNDTILLLLRVRGSGRLRTRAAAGAPAHARLRRRTRACARALPPAHALFQTEA